MAPDAPKKWTDYLKSENLKEILREYAWLSRYSLHYKGQVLWYIFIGIVGILMSLAGSILSKYIIDSVTGLHINGILVAMIFFIFMQLFQILVSAISSRISTRISLKVNQEITAQVYDKVLNSDWESLQIYHSGDLLTRVAGDVSAVSSSVLGWFPDCLTRLLYFIGTFIVILYYDSTLALLGLLSAPITLLMSRYVLRMMRHHNKKMRALSSKMMAFNEESFQNIHLLKSFDSMDAYSQKHRVIQKEYIDASMDFNRFSIRKNTIMSIVGTVVSLVCFSWSIYRLWSGHITYGTMTMFLQLTAALGSTFTALANLIPSAISTATAAGRIMAIMELPDEDRTDNQRVEAFRNSSAAHTLSVRATSLSFHYADGISILADINFEAHAGEITAIVGPSGKGKTTFLRLLLGIVNPKDGTLELLTDTGEAIPISPSTRTLFAYVPQGNTFFSGTLAENLRLIKEDATEDEMYEALRIACAEDFVRKLPLGLHSPVWEQGGGFSEGQLQRLCIARALLSDAPILLMDEATSALDMETETRVLENIIASQKNRTCILTTHRPSVLKISHRVYQVDNNNIRQIDL